MSNNNYEFFFLTWKSWQLFPPLSLLFSRKLPFSIPSFALKHSNRSFIRYLRSWSNTCCNFSQYPSFKLPQQLSICMRIQIQHTSDLWPSHSILQPTTYKFYPLKGWYTSLCIKILTLINFPFLCPHKTVQPSAPPVPELSLQTICTPTTLSILRQFPGDCH